MRKKKRILFPLSSCAGFKASKNWKLFNADEGRDLAAEIRERHIPDFSIDAEARPGRAGPRVREALAIPPRIGRGLNYRAAANPSRSITPAIAGFAAAARR